MKITDVKVFLVCDPPVYEKGFLFRIHVASFLSLFTSCRERRQ